LTLLLIRAREAEWHLHDACKVNLQGYIYAEYLSYIFTTYITVAALAAFDFLAPALLARPETPG
jgi:hypothetical protein